MLTQVLSKNNPTVSVIPRHDTYIDENTALNTGTVNFTVAFAMQKYGTKEFLNATEHVKWEVHIIEGDGVQEIEKR